MKLLTFSVADFFPHGTIMKAAKFGRDVRMTGFAASRSTDHFQTSDPSQLGIYVDLFSNIITTTTVAAFALHTLQMQRCSCRVTLQAGGVTTVFRRQMLKRFGVC
jgi:hypothetical protein